MHQKLFLVDLVYHIVFMVFMRCKSTSVYVNWSGSFSKLWNLVVCIQNMNMLCLGCTFFTVQFRLTMTAVFTWTWLILRTFERIIMPVSSNCALTLHVLCMVPHIEHYNMDLFYRHRFHSPINRYWGFFRTNNAKAISMLGYLLWCIFCSKYF